MNSAERSGMTPSGASEAQASSQECARDQPGNGSEFCRPSHPCGPGRDGPPHRLLRCSTRVRRSSAPAAWLITRSGSIATPMEACLEAAAWDRAEHYADELRLYTSAEPLPWADFFIRARASLGGPRPRRSDAAASKATCDASETRLRGRPSHDVCPPALHTSMPRPVECADHDRLESEVNRPYRPRLCRPSSSG